MILGYYTTSRAMGLVIGNNKNWGEFTQSNVGLQVSLNEPTYYLITEVEKFINGEPNG